MFSFTVTARSSSSAARCGVLQTPHGAVETPVFMPVGTRGTVKGILPDRLAQCGAGLILANTYHLLLRPGADVVESLGGLHRFMGWAGPILTDSGGYQVFSLSELNRIGEDEVEFVSHIDGARIKLSPAIATDVQNKLGADIIMAFDECVPYPSSPDRLRQAVDRTIRWAEQSRAAHRRGDQWMFGIVQGGTDRQLRSICSEELRKLDFPGYAIGGLSVGEGHEEMIGTVEHTVPLLPGEKPRYLMGVGMPRDLAAAIGAGIDMFDCVLPTRNGRNAFAFTRGGPLRLRNQQYQLQTGPLDEECDCYTCRNFSRGYLRHLFLVGEMAGPILVSLHNLAFYQWLLSQARQAIREDRYAEWSGPWLRYDVDRMNPEMN
ncbi:MAG: Queuine tRNA-ribosyltransferase [Planctomycetes bacterium ADurb.Bin412]|nr:MAG: Queuine tRNA-ribosyltransferase [Planctomycetes bacterium ADurb.Bin412]